MSNIKPKRKTLHLPSKDEEVFEYNSRITYQENFGKWYVMNSDEKSSFNETPYTKEKGKTVFHNIYGEILAIDKLAHSIKVNADGILEDVLVIE